MNKIGVMLEAFHTDILSSIALAAKSGAEGVQFYGGTGISDCDRLSSREKLDIRRQLKNCGLTVSAICADLGGHGFAKESDNPQRIQKTKSIMQWTKELDCSIITTHLGVIPNEKNNTWHTLADACKRLNELGETFQISVALETGSETVQTLKQFLTDINCPHIAVNYDPANLVMVTGDDPCGGVLQVHDKIVHVHVKDGIMLKQADPSFIYNYFAEGGIEDFRLSDYYLETPLGKGSVDIPKWIKTLKSVSYNGFYTIERETHLENCFLEISSCVSLVRTLLQ